MSAASIDTIVSSCAPGTVAFRRRLHQIPELCYEESKTAAAIRAELTQLGITPIVGLADAPTATVAVLGDPGKPCIALRADIDALPLVEATGAEYASVHSGRMHACGHDGHSAMLVGAAAVLRQIADSLPVCVKCIWQPAEEGGGGAERLVKAGVLDGRVGPKVKAIFGLHGWPALPVGMVSTRPGSLMASTDNFSVRMIGRGCHGAFPHLGRDPIVASAEAVLSLQQIASREVDPVDSVIVTVGRFHGGSAINIIPTEAIFEGTVRALTPSTRAYARQAVDRRIQGIAAATDCTAEINWIEGYPPVINDVHLTDYAARTAAAVLGEGAYIPAGSPCMGGEDFSYYQELIPGCFLFLGLKPKEASEALTLHHPAFNFNDDAIPTGIRLLVELARNWRGDK